MNIHEKLVHVQSKLNAPRSQYNNFGKYHYRNLEDINEAVKPLLVEHGLSLILTDCPVVCGSRIYIEATATLTNTEKPEEIVTAKGYAREAESKKGMDDSQVTGATSSYARKYCLNGLFAIDDTKDADHGANESDSQYLDKKQVSTITDMINHVGADETAFLKWIGAESVEAIPKQSFNKAMTALKGKEKKQ